MLQNSDQYAHYAILTAMLAPAFFLTATASLLLSANNRLARIIDRARTLLKELQDIQDPLQRAIYEQRISLQRRRSLIILRAGQLLYGAISLFVGTSLAVAADSLFAHRLGQTKPYTPHTHFGGEGIWPARWSRLCDTHSGCGRQR